MTSFEEKYKKKTPVDAAPGAVESPPAIEVLKAAAEVGDDYEAFHGQAESQFDLWIRTNDANEDPETSLPYGRRNKMTTDGAGFLITMHYDGPVLSVRLHGRGLAQLHHKLLRHEVEWVREFDPRKWETPAEGKPCITGIEIRHRAVPEKNSDALPGETKTEPEKPSTH